jgi:uncharacterized protein with HEPN domain
VRDPAERLRDILDAIAAIQRRTPADKTAFELDELVQVWCLHNLQIIGEAARGLPDATRALAPSIPWLKIIGMRNVLVHGYFDIDIDVVWNAVYRDVPALKPAIADLLEQLEHDA